MTVPEPRRGGCPTRPAEQSSAVSHSGIATILEPRRALLARPDGDVRAYVGRAAPSARAIIMFLGCYGLII